MQKAFDLSDERAAKINLLKRRVVEAEKKLVATEEELKANKVELVAKVEDLEKAWTEVGQLGGGLTKLRKEVPSLRSQLDQAKVAAAKAISKFQASEEMATTKKSIHEVSFDTGMWAFMYTVVTEHLD